MTATAKYPLIAGALVALALAFGPPGEVAAQQEQQMQPATPAAEISEEKLDAFAGAALDIRRVQEDLNAELQNVQNPDEVEALQQQAQEEAVQAVEDQGLTVQEYNGILEAANANPELHSTIVALMQEKSQ